VGEELYRRFPDATEGELTALRAALVSSAALAEVGRELAYPTRRVSVVGRKTPAVADAPASRRACTNRWWARATSKVGSTPRALWSSERWVDVIAATLAAPRKSPKTLLQEWAQAAHHPLPLYRTLDVSGPEHRRGFVVEVEVAGNVAQGTGASSAPRKRPQPRSSWSW